MSVRAVFLLALLLAYPAAVRAQTTDKPGDKPPTIHVGGYVQFDYLSDFENRTDVPRTDSEQTFRFRRVRLVLTGTIVENVEYAVTVEVTTTPILRDATIVLKHFPAATIRAGQFVMPYGQEQYGISSNVLEFTERLLTPIVPARDAGVMVTNAQPFGGWLT
jgi:phosphate-selective porin